MPSNNKTPLLELNQWAGDEYPKRVDFNLDNSKIDAAVSTLFDTKVDVASGKGLSTNDYTNEDKAKVRNLPENTQSKFDDVYTYMGEHLVSKIPGKGLSTNDLTDSLMSKITKLGVFFSWQAPTLRQYQDNEEIFNLTVPESGTYLAIFAMETSGYKFKLYAQTESYERGTGGYFEIEPFNLNKKTTFALFELSKDTSISMRASNTFTSRTVQNGNISGGARAIFIRISD